MKNFSILLLLSILLSLTIVSVKSSKQETPTPQPGKQTRPSPERRREDSRAVYTGLLNAHDGRIPEIVANRKENIRIQREIGLPTLVPYAPPFDLTEYLSSRACDADAIITGRIRGKVSQLTEDETFIYTRYQLSVDDVLKDNNLAAFRSSDLLTVLRQGGTIDVKGVNVVAEDKAAKSLEVGQQYLLFLTYLPDKGVYVADNLAYQITNKQLLKLTEQQLQSELESGQDAVRFFRLVQSAADAPCPGEVGAT